MSEKLFKILIIRFSSIGDILLTTPFIRQMRKNFPKAHITYLVKKQFSELVKYNSNLNEIISFDSTLGYKGLKNLSIKIKKNEYNLIYDLHNNIRSNKIVANLDNDRVFKISKDKLRRFFLVFFKLNFYKKIFTVPEKYLNVGITTGIKDNEEKLELSWSGETASYIENLLNEKDLNKDRYICLAPGAAHFTKMWPIERVSEVITRILIETNLKIVLVGGKNEKNLLSNFQNDKRIVHFFGKLSLLETAGIINFSKGLLTNDSGLMHMAVSVKKPVIAIFGSTTKELGFFPFRADSTVIENENLWCRPCTHIGRNYCPLGHFKCMNEISVETVYNSLKEKIL